MYLYPFMSPPSLFVVIPGFGAPNVSAKLQILEKNLQVITSYDWRHLLIRICVYDDTPLPDWVTQHPNLELIRERGIVAEFLIRHANPSTIPPHFNYFMGLMDDILLGTPFPWPRVLRWMDELKLDIISPSLTHDSKHVYKYMLQDASSQPLYHLRMTRVCEFFCYIMPRASYDRYYTHLDPQNPWLWGLDIILERHLQMRVALMNVVLMKHFFQSEGYQARPDKPPMDGYHYTLKKYGEFDEEVLRNQKHTKYIIYDATQ